MTKDNGPQKHQTDYHKDLVKHALKFEAAVNAHKESRGDEEIRLKAVMEDHLQQIQAATNEIQTKEMHKQSVKLAKSTHEYFNYKSDENFAAVEQDLQTLMEYNQI